MKVKMRSTKIRRMAVSGILAALIMFIAIFSTGTGVFLYVNASNQTANKASANEADSQLEATQEKLAVSAAEVTPTCVTDCQLWLRVNNTGGIPTTIIDVYVTCISSCEFDGKTFEEGQLMSQSSVAGSFLSQAPADLNTSLPYTLAIGAVTRISISTNAFSYTQGNPDEFVVVSVLTSRGNVFSGQFPPPPVPSVTYAGVETVSTNAVESLVGGGPQLSVLLSATANCPITETPGCTQTFSCSDGCITVTATVYNLASVEAYGVSLTLDTPYSNFVSGTASVTPYSSPPCGPTSLNIAANSQGTFTCQFDASTGASGGLASFSGHATAQSLYGVTITSAEALSNSVEIGGLASVPTQGAFVANFFYLKYSSCYQDTGTNFVSPCTTNIPKPIQASKLPSGSFIAAGANFYVAWYMQITNVFNTTVPILQYSYTYGDPTVTGEVFYFLAGSNTAMTNGVYYPNYAASTPTLTPYPTDCNVVNGNNIPTDPSCIYVNPGQTVTLTFAACGYGASNWAWGGQQDASTYDNSAGCTGNAPNIQAPEGVQLGIVVSFYYNGKIDSEFMPFEGQSYLRSVATTVSCVPSTAGLNTQSVCTATATDNDARGTPITPTGAVTFSQTSGTGSVIFPYPPTCTLSAGACSITVTGSTTGIADIQASYSGDYWHMGSNGTTNISVVGAQTITKTSTYTTTTTSGTTSLETTTKATSGTTTFTTVTSTTSGTTTFPTTTRTTSSTTTFTATTPTITTVTTVTSTTLGTSTITTTTSTTLGTTTYSVTTSSTSGTTTYTPVTSSTSSTTTFPTTTRTTSSTTTFTTTSPTTTSVTVVTTTSSGTSTITTTTSTTLGTTTFTVRTTTISGTTTFSVSTTTTSGTTKFTVTTTTTTSTTYTA